MKKIMMITLIVLVITGCNKMSYSNLFNDPYLYSKTIKAYNYVIMSNNLSPIVASRCYTYASIAAYEVIVIGDKRFQSLAGQIKHLPAITFTDTTHVNFQYAALLAFCKVGEVTTFPTGSMKEQIKIFDSIAKESGMTSQMKKASENLANSISDQIINWSKKDNYAKTRTAPNYEIVTDEPGRWEPTPPAFSQALEPYWNKIRPMIMDSANQFLTPRPPTFDMKNKKSEFYSWVLQVKNAGDNLTNEQKHIAEFWDDLGNRVMVSGHVMLTKKKFSPPGHWMNIVGIASKKAKADFSTTVAAYAKTAIASFDAFIQCWDEKYRSKLLRPETAINKFIDPQWRPYLQTPPFPEYTCGHSTVSASAAEVLTGIFGDNFAYTDTSEIEFGIKSRSFKSFREAAIENNWARFYGGIHYHGTCLISNVYGRKVGNLINENLKMIKSKYY